ncbi:MAG: biosynthetic-type acetolactate synthase large subunit [Eubacteriales bacterium]|nr:biosynthetic-type acetolactate synthase large subunit [Eubacteriales bacterium]
MILTGARIIVEVLIEQGCDTVFGYPGGFVLNIYDELYKNRNRINHIITAHEQGAAHAADGYARASGNVGVVMATSGPGVTNLVTGIATAYLDSTPLVAITGNVPLNMLGKDSFQEVDSTGITMPITKHNYIVKDVRDLADIIREAFQIAKSGRPGPVLIDVPKDVQLAECEYTAGKIIEKRKTVEPDATLLELAAKYISEAERPYIYSGGGVVISDTGEEIANLAELIDAPIGFSMMGLSAVPGNNPRNLGMTGMHGRYASTKANSEADLIIAVGVRFSDRATGNKTRYTKNAKIIHIDIDPAEIDKNISAYIGITGDIKLTLKHLISMLVPAKHSEWQKEVKAYLEEERSYYPKENRLTPKTLIERINSFCDDDTVIATDVGQHQMWAAQYCAFNKPRRFLTSGGLGTMGFGMGAAIGGCIAAGKKKAVLLTGDGSFGMNLTEMATAVKNRLPLIVVIFNNGVLGMVRQWQTLFYDRRYSETTLERSTDFVKLAEAFGAEGYRAENIGELDGILEKAFAADTPVIIDCVIDKDENVFPMIPPNGSIENIIVK